MVNAMRVLLVDDHIIFREGLVLLLETTGTCEVVDEIGSVGELLDTVANLKPDIVVSDYNIPGEDTLAAFELLKQSVFSGKLVILTGITSVRVYQKLMEIGVDGILDKSIPAKEMISAITRLIDSDECILSPSVEEQLKNKSLGLTPREMAVIDLVVKGFTNQKIAEQLSIAPKTVDNHRTNIFKKLNISNAVELVEFARKHGLMLNEP